MASEYINMVKILKNENGQSMVEYILLVAVIVSLISVVVNSDAFQGTFGEDGKFSKTYKAELEYSYRHGLRGRIEYQIPNYLNRNHDTFFKSGVGTRFFTSAVAYP